MLCEEEGTGAAFPRGEIDAEQLLKRKKGGLVQPNHRGIDRERKKLVRSRSMPGKSLSLGVLYQGGRGDRFPGKLVNGKKGLYAVR